MHVNLGVFTAAQCRWREALFWCFYSIATFNEDILASINRLVLIMKVETFIVKIVVNLVLFQEIVRSEVTMPLHQCCANAYDICKIIGVMVFNMCDLLQVSQDFNRFPS